MKPSVPTVETILAEAVEIADPTERAAFLDRACAGNTALRARLGRMADDHFRAGSFLEHPPAPVLPDNTVAFHRTEVESAVGTRVGPYILRELLGEGGMGAVYVAEQSEPVKRRVALKVIKPGMDSRQVVARFEAERQALALMDHPNIARILDGGTTDAGRPFFVMELVRGIPITDYCDQAGLTNRERLELFALVCAAVQHAHQKGVIHRDLKPSNVLVTLYDGRPVPKVIDFGIAKAVGSSLTDKTVYTGFAQLIGTPLYMSPEQAELSALDVDTRADVYALGVLLYELLSGTTPFDAARFRAAGFDEIRRIIREDEPLRPSQRLSTLAAEALSTVSTRRGVEGRRLVGMLRGELDWVVMKCLEKDRNRRYESASALAADVQRYLADEPVTACPPTPGYRLRKFARRHKVALGTAAVVAAALIAGTAVSVWQAVRATHATNAEVAQRVRAEERTRLARDVIQEFYIKVANEWLFDEPQLQGARREFVERALTFSRQLLDERPTDAKAIFDHALTLRLIAAVERGLGQFAESERHYREAIALYDEAQSAGQDAVNVYEGLTQARLKLAALLVMQQQYPEAEEVARQAISDAETALKLMGDDSQRRAAIVVADDEIEDLMASILGKTGRLEDARQMRLRQIDKYRRRVHEKPNDANAHHSLSGTLQNLASLMSRRNSQDVAVQPLLEEAIVHGTRALELQPHKRFWKYQLAIVYGTLASHHKDRGRFGPAEQAIRASIQRMGRLVEDFPQDVDYRGKLAVDYNDLAFTLWRSKRWDEAEPAFQKAIALNEQILRKAPSSAESRSFLGGTLHNLGIGQEEARRYNEAEKSLRRAEEVLGALASDRPTLNNRFNWGAALNAYGRFLNHRGRYEEAMPVLRRCLEVRTKLAEEQPKDLTAQSDLAVALHDLGSSLYNSGKPAEAIDLLRRALAVQRRSFDAQPINPGFRRNLWAHHMKLADILADAPDLVLRHPEEAIDHARKAIELRPKHSVGAWFYLGVAQYRIGDPAAAIQSFEKVEAIDKGDEDDICLRNYFLAMCYFKTGKGDHARACFDRAEKLWEAARKIVPGSPSLPRTRREAAALLGRDISDPKKPAK